MSPYYTRLRASVGSDLLLVPGVAAVIHDAEGRLLLVRKTDASWSLPAGAIEPGETPEDAVRREVREETGFEVRGAAVLGVFGGEGFRHTYPNGHRTEYLVVLFRCDAGAAGPIGDPGEIAACEWFDRGDCPPLALPYPRELLFPEACAP